MHINEMLNKKTYIGDIEPNPKEFGIWIKNDGSHMIYDYTNREWICNCSGGSSKVLYYKATTATDMPFNMVAYCASFKIFDTHDYKFEYVPTFTIISDMYKEVFPNDSSNDPIYFVYLPLDMKSVSFDGTTSHIVASTFEDLCIAMGQEMPAGITRITEEEYWDDSVPNPTFTIGVYEMYITTDLTYNTDWVIAEYEYEPDMTFEDWINSKYNVDKIRINTTAGTNVDFYYPKYDFVGNRDYNDGLLAFSNQNGKIQLNSLMTDVVAHPTDSENGVTVEVTSGYRCVG